MTRVGWGWKPRIRHNEVSVHSADRAAVARGANPDSLVGFPAAPADPASPPASATIVPRALALETMDRSGRDDLGGLRRAGANTAGAGPFFVVAMAPQGPGGATAAWVGVRDVPGPHEVLPPWPALAHGHGPRGCG